MSDQHQTTLSNDDVVRFQSEGFLILDAPPLVPMLSKLRGEISKLIALRSGLEIDTKGTRDECFDAGLLGLCRLDRNHGRAVFDAGSRLLTLHQLSIEPWLLAVARDLMGTDFPQVALDKAIRMDLPGEDRFLFPLHQDYTYDPSSPNGLVFWIPLRRVDAQSGALSIALGSHHQGVRRVRVLHDRTMRGPGGITGNALYELSDIEDIERASMELAELDFGQVLVFSNLLVHASNANLSDDIRWTVQVRFGDFKSDLPVGKGWPHGNFRGHYFYETHPEFIEY